jgi:hypothetical protein
MMNRHPRTILVTEVAIAVALTFGPLLLAVGRLAGYGS